MGLEKGIFIVLVKCCSEKSFRHYIGLVTDDMIINLFRKKINSYFQKFAGDILLARSNETVRKTPKPLNVGCICCVLSSHRLICKIFAAIQLSHYTLIDLWCPAKYWQSTM